MTIGWGEEAQGEAATRSKALLPPSAATEAADGPSLWRWRLRYGNGATTATPTTAPCCDAASAASLISPQLRSSRGEGLQRTAIGAAAPDGPFRAGAGDRGPPERIAEDVAAAAAAVRLILALDDALTLGEVGGEEKVLLWVRCGKEDEDCISLIFKTYCFEKG